MATLAEVLRAKSNAALAARSAVQTTPEATSKPEAAPKPRPQSGTTLERVDINVSRNRLDLYFRGVPEQGIRSDMKVHGFRYNPDLVCWYHQDTEANRQFIRKSFAVEIERKEPKPGPIVPTPATLDPRPEYLLVPEPAPVASPAEEPTTEPFTPEFSRFRTQVDELIAHLKIAPADLMLLAIDSLHKGTFSRDS